MYKLDSPFQGNDKIRRGFTLIELSIVLVIIGLIIGGVMVGKELIRNFQMQATFSQMEKLNTAANTFKLKYGQLPGDINNAVNFGLGSSTSWHNGDDNGNIYSDIVMMGGNVGVRTREMVNFPYHLSLANLLEGTYTGYNGYTSFAGSFVGYSLPTKLYTDVFISPVTALDTSQGDFAMGNIYMMHSQDTSNPQFATRNALTASEALQMDTKIDDGNPLAGNVRTFTPYAGPRVSANWDGCMAVISGRVVYDTAGIWANYAIQVQNSPANPAQRRCGLAFKAQW